MLSMKKKEEGSSENEIWIYFELTSNIDWFINYKECLIKDFQTLSSGYKKSFSSIIGSTVAMIKILRFTASSMVTELLMAV